MFYGIISNLDDATTRVFLKNKKVPDTNIVHIAQLPALVQVLKSGDMVFVVSVNRFRAVSQFLNLGKFCMAHGVSLHLLAQPCLDISSGRHWKPVFLNQMVKMVEAERGAIGQMVQGFKFTSGQ